MTSSIILSFEYTISLEAFLRALLVFKYYVNIL